MRSANTVDLARMRQPGLSTHFTLIALTVSRSTGSTCGQSAAYVSASSPRSSTPAVINVPVGSAAHSGLQGGVRELALAARSIRSRIWTASCWPARRPRSLAASLSNSRGRFGAGRPRHHGADGSSRKRSYFAVRVALHVGEAHSLPVDGGNGARASAISSSPIATSASASAPGKAEGDEARLAWATNTIREVFAQLLTYPRAGAMRYMLTQLL